VGRKDWTTRLGEKSKCIQPLVRGTERGGVVDVEGDKGPTTIKDFD